MQPSVQRVSFESQLQQLFNLNLNNLDCSFQGENLLYLIKTNDKNVIYGKCYFWLLYIWNIYNLLHMLSHLRRLYVFCYFAIQDLLFICKARRKSTCEAVGFMRKSHQEVTWEPILLGCKLCACVWTTGGVNMCGKSAASHGKTVIDASL